MDDNLVAAIEQALGENIELTAARGVLFANSVPEKQMYMPMVSARVRYCGESSPERVTGHSASSYLNLQCPVQAQRQSSFVG